MQEAFPTTEIEGFGARNTLPRTFVKKDSGNNLINNNGGKIIQWASSQSKLQDGEANSARVKGPKEKWVTFTLGQEYMSFGVWVVRQSPLFRPEPLQPVSARDSDSEMPPSSSSTAYSKESSETQPFRLFVRNKALRVRFYRNGDQFFKAFLFLLDLIF